MLASSYSTRLVKAVALLVVVLASAAPAAQSADVPDAVDRYLRNQAAVNAAREIPDFVDRYVASQSAGKSADLRLPDTRDLAAGHVPTIPDFVDRYVASHSAGKSRDLRSPDTRDFAAGHLPTISPVPVSSPASGFDWGDAGIGAGVAGALMLLLLGTRELVAHRRRDTAPGTEASVFSN